MLHKESTYPGRNGLRSSAQQDKSSSILSKQITSLTSAPIKYFSDNRQSYSSLNWHLYFSLKSRGISHSIRILYWDGLWNGAKKMPSPMDLAPWSYKLMDGWCPDWVRYRGPNTVLMIFTLVTFASIKQFFAEKWLDISLLVRVTKQGLDGSPGNIAAAGKKTLDCKSGTLIFRVILASGPQMQYYDASPSKTTPMSM